MNEANVADIQADIEGPEGTPFEGGTFRMRLALGPEYPAAPPKGYFVTRIFHPNVATSGEICVNTLKRDWQPSHGVRHILMVVRCLLIEPFPESALNEEASSLLLDDYEEYAKNARLMTSIHAAPKTLKETDSNRMQAQKATEKGKQAAGVKKPKRASLEKKKSLRRL